MNYYLNRELSWLKFNRRVLDEAVSDIVPYYERLKFTAIFTSNLDEFFMIRVGSMSDRAALEKKNNVSYSDDKTGMTASQQLDAMYAAVHPLAELRDTVYQKVSNQLAELGIRKLNLSELSTEKAKETKNAFKRNIMPLLSPQIIDTKHPFPHLENKRLYVVLMLKNNGRTFFGLIPVLNQHTPYERIMYVDGEASTPPYGLSYLLTEEIILKHSSIIFKQYNIAARAIIKVTRNADVEIADIFSDEENIDYCDYMKLNLKKREKLAPVRLEIYTGGYQHNTKLIKYFAEKLGLSIHQCYMSSSAPLDMSYVFALENKLRGIERNDSKLLYQPHVPFVPIFENSVTEEAYKRDILLFYPYCSMKPYLKLLEEAAVDDNTVSIKITLYRLSGNSEVIRLLCLAAEKKREVTVIVELKARFDEESNINWARHLEEAGCNVIYGIEGLKIHSKITLITRRADSNLMKVKLIAHIGTGNYNEKTALQYTDLGIITSDDRLCADAVDFFNDMTLGSIAKAEYKYLLAAPNTLRSGVISEIQAEASKGVDGYIFIKMNGLTDKIIIDELVRASQCGVRIDLIVRGVCCLLPGIVGITDNIHVYSIIGRYLEHSRFAIFGVDSASCRIYIGSADLMTRNTTRRVEIWTPIFDDAIRADLIAMKEIALSDNVKSRILCSNGEYERVISDAPPLNSQDAGDAGREDAGTRSL